MGTPEQWKGLELGRVMVSRGFGKMSLALLLEGMDLGTEYREAAGTGEGRLHEGGTGKGRSPRKDAAGTGWPGTGGCSRRWGLESKIKPSGWRLGGLLRKRSEKMQVLKIRSPVWAVGSRARETAQLLCLKLTREIGAGNQDLRIIKE